MLRNLRWQLVLLNAVISGAILLTMALVSLGITETRLSQQYERDLTQNANQMISAVLSTGANERTQFATNYMVYYEDNYQRRLVSNMLDAESAPALINELASKASEMVSGHAVTFNTDDVLVAEFFVAIPQEGEHQSISIAKAPASVVTMTTASNMLLSAGGRSFRAYVTKVYATNPSTIMVLQDRTEELAIRDGLRWVFLGCCLGGLLLVALASLYLSRRAIRPVETSISQQRAFVAAASHELRTPVAAVRANAEVLADAELGDFTPYLGAIDQESRRMSRLVGDLMDLARADAGEMPVKAEPVGASEVAASAVQAMEPLAQHQGIALDMALEPANITGDGQRLKQVLIILLDNALRYTPSGGKVSLVCTPKGHQVSLQVIDDGPGIPDVHKAQVFDRFYRIAADRPADGCGLGLSIARELVERMRGELLLTDAPGGGCVFEVRLRLAR